MWGGRSLRTADSGPPPAPPSGSLNLVIISSDDDVYDFDGVLKDGDANQIFMGNTIDVILDGGFRFDMGASTIPSGVTITQASFKCNIFGVTSGGGSIRCHVVDLASAQDWTADGPATVPISAAYVQRTMSTIQLETFNLVVALQQVLDARGTLSTAVSVVMLDRNSGKDKASQASDFESGSDSATFDIAWA